MADTNIIQRLRNLILGDLDSLRSRLTTETQRADAAEAEIIKMRLARDAEVGSAVGALEEIQGKVAALVEGQESAPADGPSPGGVSAMPEDDS